jgi:hypothetical protein
MGIEINLKTFTMKQETFNNKEEIVNVLVSEWKMKKSSFYNTPTNKQREKFWTYSRCLRHLMELRQDWRLTDYGRERHSLHGVSLNKNFPVV